MRETKSDLAGIAGETATFVQPIANERRIAPLILDLRTNALEHTPAAGRLTPCTSVKSGRAFFAITGTGIAADCLPQIFERF